MTSAPHVRAFSSPEIPYRSMTSPCTEAAGIGLVKLKKWIGVAPAQECSAHRESQDGGAKWGGAKLMKRHASGGLHWRSCHIRHSHTPKKDFSFVIHCSYQMTLTDP
jgi:hypothetical protein